LKNRISLIHFAVVGELRDRYGLRLHVDLSDGLANRFQTLVEAEGSKLAVPDVGEADEADRARAGEIPLFGAVSLEITHADRSLKN
jgi:hypothetical protein